MPKSKARKRGMEPSPLSAHRRDGKILQTPMNQLANIELSSWVNEVLPEMLWAALLVNAYPRSEYLSKIRSVIEFVGKNKDKFKDHRLDQTALALIDEEVFDELFAELCKEEPASKALACLLLIEELPGVKRWEKYLEVPEEGDEGRIQDAIAASYDHQGEKATDIRWLRAMVDIARDKIHFSSSVAGALDRVLKYGDDEDFNAAGSTVRALEMATRANPPGEAPNTWAETFWKLCFQVTQCLPSNPDEKREVASYGALGEEVIKLYEELVKHFMTTIEKTESNPRHEGAFGLTFYIMHLTFLALNASVGQTVQGRLVLRSAVEALINLMFLVKKDDCTIWMQYRNYGAAQAKLAFLKYKEEDAPSFVTKDLLETLANADLWMEYQDIKLGAWADKNLRKMAEEADAKHLYDKYYDTLSGYIHGNWAAVSHSAFGLCLNPLHRFHRIPLPPRFFVEDAAPDMVKLINVALDQVTMLYPPFKPRLKFEAIVKE